MYIRYNRRKTLVPHGSMENLLYFIAFTLIEREILYIEMNDFSERILINRIMMNLNESYYWFS